MTITTSLLSGFHTGFFEKGGGGFSKGGGDFRKGGSPQIPALSIKFIKKFAIQQHNSSFTHNVRNMKKIIRKKSPLLLHSITSQSSNYLCSAEEINRSYGS